MKIVFKEKQVSIIILALLLYTATMLTKSEDIKLVVLMVAISMLHVIHLMMQNKYFFKKVVRNNAIRWITVVWIIIMLYGYFGEYKEAYSILYHILNYIYIIVFALICYFYKNDLINLIAPSFTVTLLLIIVHTVSTSLGSIWRSALEGVRIGSGGTGNVNSAAITYAFLLIPIIFIFFSEKRRIYGIPMILGICFMLITGSKKGIIFLLMVGMVYFFSVARNKRKVAICLLSAVGIVLFLLLAVYFINPLHELVWVRLENMFSSLQNYNEGDTSSTSLRLTFIKTVLTKFGDKPFLGHGWGAFANMYGYVPLYKMHLYSHCNYTEILFSFGIIGFLIYYAYYVATLKKAKNIKSDRKVLALLFIISIIFFDITSVTCYDMIVGYLCVLLASWISEGESDLIEKII